VCVLHSPSSMAMMGGLLILVLLRYVTDRGYVDHAVFLSDRILGFCILIYIVNYEIIPNVDFVRST
jgi:hypothetical protein